MRVFLVDVYGFVFVCVSISDFLIHTMFKNVSRSEAVERLKGMCVCMCVNACVSRGCVWFCVCVCIN
jgi:hypothetical protein